MLVVLICVTLGANVLWRMLVWAKQTRKCNLCDGQDVNCPFCHGDGWMTEAHARAIRDAIRQNKPIE